MALPDHGVCRSALLFVFTLVAFTNVWGATWTTEAQYACGQNLLPGSRSKAPFSVPFAVSVDGTAVSGSRNHQVVSEELTGRIDASTGETNLQLRGYWRDEPKRSWVVTLHGRTEGGEVRARGTMYLPDGATKVRDCTFTFNLPKASVRAEQAASGEPKTSPAAPLEQRQSLPSSGETRQGTAIPKAKSQDGPLVSGAQQNESAAAVAPTVDVAMMAPATMAPTSSLPVTDAAASPKAPPTSPVEVSAPAVAASAADLPATRANEATGGPSGAAAPEGSGPSFGIGSLVIAVFAGAIVAVGVAALLRRRRHPDLGPAVSAAGEVHRSATESLRALEAPGMPEAPEEAQSQPRERAKADSGYAFGKKIGAVLRSAGGDNAKPTGATESQPQKKKFKTVREYLLAMAGLTVVVLFFNFATGRMANSLDQFLPLSGTDLYRYWQVANPSNPGQYNDELIEGIVLHKCSAEGKYPAQFGVLRIKTTFDMFAIKDPKPFLVFVGGIDYGSKLLAFAAQPPETGGALIVARLKLAGCDVPLDLVNRAKAKAVSMEASAGNQ